MFKESNGAVEVSRLLREDVIQKEKLENKLMGLSQDDLTWIAIEFLDDYDAIDGKDISFSADLFGTEEEAETRVIDLESRMKTLLEAGLDPNHIVDEDNPIWTCQYVTAAHNLNARILRLLLQYGGDPCIKTEPRGEDIYSYVNYKMGNETDQIETLIPYFLMLSGFGGRLYGGICPVVMNDGHSLEELKEIEKLEWYFGPFLEGPDRQDCYTLHIYNAETNEEIGHY